MYTFKPYTERVARLRDAVRDRLMVADSEKARLQLEAKKKYIKYPPLLQKPYISLYVLERMPLNIQEDEYFFGGLGNKGWGGAGGMAWLGVDIENTWPIQEDGLHHAPDDDPFYSHQRMAISPEELKKLREIAKEYLALEGGPSGFPRGSTCPAVLRIPLGCAQFSPTGVLPPLPGLSRPLRLTSRNAVSWSFNPRLRRVWFGLFPVRSPLLRKSSFLSFPPLT